MRWPGVAFLFLFGLAGCDTTNTACDPECTPGEQMCEGDRIRICAYDNSGCITWSAPVGCPSGRCEAGECREAECQDECSQSGELICDGPSARRICGQHDSDSCLEYGLPQACPEGSICQSGECTGSCREECNPGEFCHNGQCLPQGACVDECEFDGYRTCAGAWLYKVCRPNDVDGCLEYGEPILCEDSQLCEDGQCGGSCQDDCEAGAYGCQDEGSVWTCADEDLDPCRERVVVSCLAGQTCRDGDCRSDNACQDDDYEENDDSFAAAEIDLHTGLSGLQICAGDEDWFHFQVDSETSVSFWLHFATGDLDLFLYDESLNLVSSCSKESQKQVCLADALGTFFLVVKGSEGSEAGYDIVTGF